MGSQKAEVGGAGERVRTGVETLTCTARDLKAEVRHSGAVIARASAVVADAVGGERAAREAAVASMNEGMRRVEAVIDGQRGRHSELVAMLRRLEKEVGLVGGGVVGGGLRGRDKTKGKIVEERQSESSAPTKLAEVSVKSQKPWFGEKAQLPHAVSLIVWLKASTS